MKTFKTKLALIFTLMLLSFFCQGQETKVQRKDLQHILLDQQLHQVEMQEITLEKAQKVPAHFHPCPVIGFILEGEIIFEITGQKPKLLKSGDTFYEPKNREISAFNNLSKTGVAKFIAIYLKAGDEKTIELLNTVK
ncbi:cupin domain-containing protein [Sphingobacterium sp. HMA12]|uniref:cupin domain-containing protein n=1 Tax=Sphingobacterium sp. HMA12 TaxID=2050894 RepID=UPI000CEA50D4|nr:cupin domain-containing protein [Sphingobacterium sp. HMA12]